MSWRQVVHAGAAGLEVWSQPLDDPGPVAQSQAARRFLRGLLAARLGVGLDEIEIGRAPCPSCGGPHGRPVLTRPDSGLHFSLSHCGRLVLVAIAEAPVGVDVEPVASEVTALEVATLLHHAEAREVRLAPPGARGALFTQLWTRKEAYVKGIGTGVADDLAAQYVGNGGAAPMPVGWLIEDVTVPAGLRAAVAVAVSARLPGPPEGGKSTRRPLAVEPQRPGGQLAEPQLGFV